MSGFVQGNNGTGGAGTSVVASFTTNVAGGNFLIFVAKVAAVNASLSTAISSLGNAYVVRQTQVDAANLHTVFVIVCSIAAHAGAETLTLTTTGGSGAWEWVCCEYNGYSTVNKQASGSGSGVNAALSPSITTTVPNGHFLLIGWSAESTADGRTLTGQVGYTLRQVSNGNVGIQDSPQTGGNLTTASTITYSGGTVSYAAGVLAISDNGNVTAPTDIPSTSSPTLGHGVYAKQGLFGDYRRINVPGGNASPGSNVSGAGQIFPTGFGTP